MKSTARNNTFLDRLGLGGSRLKFRRLQRRELRMVAIFLGLIMIPSALLGYFSLIALESEKRLSLERLRESYRQFGNLAAREIHEELLVVEKKWVSAVNKMFGDQYTNPSTEDIENLIKNESLISDFFLLPSSGQVTYPAGVSLREEGRYQEVSESEPYIREYEVFNDLVSRGEELEYHSYDLEEAVATYSEIPTKVSNPQLLAMAESYIGRCLIKKGEWISALTTFEKLLVKFPEMRDVNNMYLRFVAQYQIAVCLENLSRDKEAIETLLSLAKDLLDRSDSIHNLQYSFFMDQIENLTPRLLSSPNLSDATGYEAQFHTLGEHNKKHKSRKYLLQILDRRLRKMVIERKGYKAKFRYVSDMTRDEPFLLVHKALPDPQGIYVTGLFGFQIDLDVLSEQIFPKILRGLKFSEQVTLAVLNRKGDYIFGAQELKEEPLVAQTLAEPFDFWQVAIDLTDQNAVSQSGFRDLLSIWLIGLLLLSILFGTFLFFRRARQEAYLSQLKSSFVSNVSHELRTPLASINMLAELLEMQFEAGSGVDAKETKNHTQQRYLKVIRRECERLGRLIGNLLDFSKAERGLQRYNFEYEDPVIVLSQTVEAFLPYAEASGYIINVDTEEPLPELRLDADAISQALLNLLSNAVRYSDKKKQVDVRAYQVDSQLAIEVIDYGIGIHAAEIPKIFQEFYR
ncbi:HAMP domain-containing histidine kinase, partial [bacterium]|nr:HAMP domain-containing histidine kinase [bacterium]